MGKNKLDFFRARLLRELQTICSAIEQKREESRTELTSYEADPLDLCVQSFSREQLYLLCEMNRETLALVREALARIQSNSYGLCAECDSPIGHKRLMAIPWSNRCLQCQDSRESALAS